MPSNENRPILVLLLAIASIALAACDAAAEPQAPFGAAGTEGHAVATGEVGPTAVGGAVDAEVAAKRMGGWFDTVVFVQEADSYTALARLAAGDIDVYAGQVSEPDIAQRIFDTEYLAYETAYGGFDELTFTPSTGPEFKDGRLNPFYSDKIREAMNWLIDRDYIVQEIMGGLAVPRFVPINYASKDSALLADTIAAISLKYAHNPDKAVEIIRAEMEALGATMADGRWTYNGKPVVLTGLIRIEDERREIGDYVSNLLEDIGFTIQRDYKTSAEAGVCWLRRDPDEGCAHFYTGAWNSTAISRDEAGKFSLFYTPDGLPFPPWQAYSPDAEFYEIATKLSNNDFATMEERAELMAAALHYALQDSQRVWLKDDVTVAPHAADIRLASDLAGSIVGSSLWAQTMRREGAIGGSVTIAAGGLGTPWNPVAGSGGVYYGMPVLGTVDHAVVPDPFTGLALPMRLERAEVLVQEGLPVDLSLDWVTLEFVPEIVVPDDAWADWDAEKQVFLPAGERFTETQTAACKVVMYYEEDLFETVTWHDGSPLTLGDVVMSMILALDRSKEESPYYDESSVPAFETNMAAFKGWRIASEDPLVIEYYTDAYQLDGENSVTDARAAYPRGPWHSLVPGLRAEADATLAFSAEKAAANEVEWASFVSGPSLVILKAELDTAQAERFIPFAPTLGRFITAEEAATRYENLQAWYDRHGHFWIGTGPYFLQRVFPVEGTIILAHNPDYPDPATRWDHRLARPPVPEVTVEGPGRVTAGEAVTYDIWITFTGEPYAAEDIDMVRYVVFDATGEVAFLGEGEPVEDSHWRTRLRADQTGRLKPGSNQLGVVVVSERAVVPVTESVRFITE